MMLFHYHADKPEELLVRSSMILPQYSHSKVLDLKQPLPFQFETVLTSKFCVLRLHSICDISLGKLKVQKSVGFIYNSGTKQHPEFLGDISSH